MSHTAVGQIQMYLCSLTRAWKILSIPGMIVGCLVLSDSISATEQNATSPDDLILYSNDYAGLVEEHWPRISLGEVDAMVVSFEALNNCWHFREPISASDDLDEFETEMAGQHPEMLKFGRGIFYKCKRLIERFDWYPGWEQLRLRAALAGDRGSRLALLRDFYQHRLERPREEYPFSPAQFVVEALGDRDPKIFNLIAVIDAPWGLRERNGPVVSAAWGLVYCHYKGNCATRESMQRYCVFMAAECTRYQNALEMIRTEAGSENNFAAAQDMAGELISAIEQERYEELGLILVY